MKCKNMERWFEYQNWYTVPKVKVEKTIWMKVLNVVSVISALFIVCSLLYKCAETEPYKPVLTRYDKMKIFFTWHSSPVPSIMSSAVLQTKQPALMAAIAVKESNGTPWAVGDGGESKGAFQVQEKHWGEVSPNVYDQVIQAEKILEELSASNAGGSLRSNLAKYNGGTNPPRVSFKYADRVIKLKASIQ